MQEWSESDLNLYLEDLASDNIQDVAFILHFVAELGREDQPEPMPTGNAKVITRLEQLVEDHSLCVVYRRGHRVYGEIRWLAARVLACEYAYQGIEKPIILKDIMQPITDFELTTIAQNKPINLRELIQQGLVPTKTEIIKPKDYAACCSKEAVEARRRNQDENE